MKQRSRVIIGGAIILGIAAFFFLAPVFYWFTAYSPAGLFTQPAQPIYKAYRSLGCMLLGFGDAYYPVSVTFAHNKPGGLIVQSRPTQGVVFSCEAPILPV